MKVVFPRDELLSACQHAAVAVPSRDVKPVLRNLKASVEEDRCTIMATDLELGIRIDLLGVRVVEAGDALLPAQRIISILRESNDVEMMIEASPDSCVVRGSRNEFEMPGEDPAAFPDVPKFEEDKYHEIVAGVLREMIRKTLFAVATGEQLRFGATTGVLWELEGDKAILVATDGRRLAWIQGAAQAKGEHSTSGLAVVPSKAMNMLEKNLTNPDELVKISFRTNEVLMKTTRAMIYSRLVEGRFPDYKRVMPTKHQDRVPLIVGPFYSAVRQAAIMTDEESKRVRFHFTKDKLTLRAAGSESGKSRVEVDVDYKGKGLEIAFDPKYLADMLKVLEPDGPLNLDLNDSNQAAVLRSEPNYVYVVVPLVDPPTAK